MSSNVSPISFASPLGCAEAAAKGVGIDPAGDRQRRKGSELRWKITHEKMELLDMTLMERDFAGECNRGETDSEAEEPLLPADQRTRATE